MKREEAREAAYGQIVDECYGERNATPTDREQSMWNWGFDAGYQAGSEGRWVPVSERLPEDAVDCWITIVDPDFEAPVVTKGGIAYGKWHLVLSGMPVVERRTVTAWMPITEPPAYKED